eukprot:1141844-Prorocentrum_lima.AAC.1
MTSSLVGSEMCIRDRKKHWEALLGKTAVNTRQQQEEEENKHSREAPPPQEEQKEEAQEEEQQLTPWPEEEIPTEAELAQLLKSMKIGKAPGTDRITTHMLKAMEPK